MKFQSPCGEFGRCDYQDSIAAPRAKCFNPLAGNLVVVTADTALSVVSLKLFQSPCGEFGRCDRSRLKPFNC